MILMAVMVGKIISCFIIKVMDELKDFIKATDETLPEIGQEVIVFYDYGDNFNYEKLYWSFDDLKYWKMNCITYWKPVK